MVGWIIFRIFFYICFFNIKSLKSFPTFVFQLFPLSLSYPFNRHKIFHLSSFCCCFIHLFYTTILVLFSFESVVILLPSSIVRYLVLVFFFVWTVWMVVVASILCKFIVLLFSKEFCLFSFLKWWKRVIILGLGAFIDYFYNRG